MPPWVTPLTHLPITHPAQPLHRLPNSGIDAAGSGHPPLAINGGPASPMHMLRVRDWSGQQCWHAQSNLTPGGHKQGININCTAIKVCLQAALPPFQGISFQLCGIAFHRNGTIPCPSAWSHHLAAAPRSAYLADRKRITCPILVSLSPTMPVGTRRHMSGADPRLTVRC